MGYFLIILCGFLFTSAMTTILISLSIYRKDGRASKYFACLCLSIGFYAFGYGMELFVNEINTMILWNLVQYIGLPFIPAFWLLFALEYTNKNMRGISKIGIFVIPLLTFFFRYTSNINYLFYLNVKVIDNGYFPVLYIEKGPWYWVNVMFVTFCFVFSNYVYLNLYRKSTGYIRKQSLLMLIASLLPWITVVMDLLNISPYHIDYGPFASTIAVILLLIAFLKYKFLNIQPLARDKIFESTNDGIIVLDANYNIIDYNPSASFIFSELRDHAVGKNVTNIFQGHKELVRSILNNTEFQLDIKEPKGNYKVNTVKITEPNGMKVGYIVTMTDITRYTDIMKKLNELASKDPLTEVFNRRHFVELSSMELKKAKRNHRPLSMIILDLDFFKQINDNYGHQAGDAVLKTVANICSESIRSTDILGRYGGEEFVIFFPETTLKDCQMIANRILQSIAQSEILYEDKKIKVTASLGVVGVDSVTDEELDYFLKYADKALYLAKSEGRNCIRSFDIEVCCSL